jgi:hypothetical protein
MMMIMMMMMMMEKVCEDVGQIQLAKDRVQSRSLVKAVMNLRVP